MNIRRSRLLGNHGTWAMAFKIEITPRNDPSGATADAVIVDDHETVLSFESKEAAESFA
jgi:chlorite dismutase